MADSTLPPWLRTTATRDPNPDRGRCMETCVTKSRMFSFAIVGILVAIALVFAAIGMVCWCLLSIRRTSSDRPAQASSYSMPADKLPPPPRLEPLDRGETATASNVFAKQLAMEHGLHSYGDTNEAGFVHIPIEEAMKRVIAALPVRSGDAQPPVKGFGLAGGESNSGRLYSEAPSWLREKK